MGRWADGAGSETCELSMFFWSSAPFEVFAHAGSDHSSLGADWLESSFHAASVFTSVRFASSSLGTDGLGTRLAESSVRRLS